MSKTRPGSRKRGNRKRRREPRRVPIRSLQAGPLQIRQEGLNVVMGLDAADPDYAKFREAMHAEASAAPKRVIELRREIKDLAAPHNALDVVCAAWMAYGMAAPGTLRPMLDGGTSTTAEYIAHVLLDRESPEPEREPTREELSTGVNLPAIGERVREIFQRLPLWFAARQTALADDIDPYLDLRVQFYMHRLGLPSLSYEWDERETLLRLFGPYSDDLKQKLGFDAADALALCEGLTAIPRERIAARIEMARDHVDRMKADVARQREGKSSAVDVEERDFVRRLAELPIRDAERWIKHSAAAWISAFLGRTASFTAAELGADASVSEDAVSAFLNQFAVDFGARGDADEWRDDPIRAVGSEIETMRRRPILHDGDGRFLPAGIEHVFFGLRDVFTAALKEDSKTWQRFDRHRARELETRALDALSAPLRADWAHSSVKYTYTTDTGEVVKGETDGILRTDSALFLIEAKAGTLPESARRASPARLERGLKDLIAAAHEQLERTAKAVATPNATFTDSNGQPITLDFRGVMRTFRISVCLEDLSQVAPCVWQLQDAGILPADERTPWVVGIHELELICSMAERPAQLAHYILRRLRAYRQKVWAMDELDFWMHYLLRGLWWEDEDLEGRRLDLLSHTDPLDAWVYGERNLAPPAKRPRQKLDKATRELLDAIESTGSASRLEAQLMLLEADSRARTRISKGLGQLARKSFRDNQTHDMTQVFGDDMAITVQSVPEGTAREHNEHFSSYGRLKCEQHGLRRWTGLTTRAGTQPKLVGMAVLADLDRIEDV